ncbi:MAG: hypothetical protein LC111_14230 [Bacteroidia bacterium]|nr:hypothetical protein [Bacteroidia bacterium]
MYTKSIKLLNIFKYLFFILPLLALFVGGCKKEIGFTEESSSKLSFSTDTVIFDTVFTEVGSATQQFKIYNPYKKKLLVKKIWLAKGQNSLFRLNIDGVPGNTANNIELMPGDSLFVFVEVTINPLNSNTPMIVTDSVLFETNNNIQDIDLVAWGQDAHYIRPNTYINGLPPLNIIAKENENITWGNDKPYVIYGYAVVDSAAVLNIEAGARIHFAKNSGLWVYRYGSLQVNGTKDSPIIFQGARLDYDYRDIPGQWDRIWINEGSISNFNYAEIKNGFIGLQVETIIGRQNNDQTLVNLKNTKIYNMTAYGLFSRYYSIRGQNLLVTNCGENTVALTMGGNYNFRHCTFANFYSASTQRQSPLLVINNYNNNQVFPLDSCYFGNCIVYGGIENEISIDSKPGQNFNYLFENTLIKVSPTTNTDNTDNYKNIIKNPPNVVVNGSTTQPLFEDINKQDYHLKANAPAINAGLPLIGQQVPLDLDEHQRDPMPDMGCYEFQ